MSNSSKIRLNITFLPGSYIFFNIILPKNGSFGIGLQVGITALNTNPLLWTKTSLTSTSSSRLNLIFFLLATPKILKNVFWVQILLFLFAILKKLSYFHFFSLLFFLKAIGCKFFNCSEVN